MIPFACKIKTKVEIEAETKCGEELRVCGAKFHSGETILVTLDPLAEIVNDYFEKNNIDLSFELILEYQETFIGFLNGEKKIVDARA